MAQEPPTRPLEALLLLGEKGAQVCDHRLPRVHLAPRGLMECWVHTVRRRLLGKGISQLVAGVKLGGTAGRPRQKWLSLAV